MQQMIPSFFNFCFPNDARKWGPVTKNCSFGVKSVYLGRLGNQCKYGVHVLPGYGNGSLDMVEENFQLVAVSVDLLQVSQVNQVGTVTAQQGWMQRFFLDTF